MPADSVIKVFAAVFLLAVLISSPSSAQDFTCDRGDIEVVGLIFEGNHTFSDAELGNMIVTTPSSWARRTFRAPFSTKRCLDKDEFRNDRLRLILFYRRRGFPDVSVDTALIKEGGNGVKAKFILKEGQPTRIRSLLVTGLDSVENRETIIDNLPVKVGDRFDRVKLDEALDIIARRLRNRGYPGVTAHNTYSTSSIEGNTVADDTLIIVTGPLTRLGDIRIVVEPAPDRSRQISDKVIRQIVGIDSGAIYREQRLLAAQRSLYETDAYWHVGIGLDSALGRRVGSDSLAPLTVSLVENMMHSARLGVGYGTLDCFRATGELDNYNFLKGARRLELRARISKIGVGKPLGGASQLCPQARNDPYSTRLNYYLGASWRQPVFFGLRTVPTITAYTQRTSEYNAYVRTTSIGGIASLAWRRGGRTPFVFSYTMDYGRTNAQPSLFCAVFNICTSEDRQRVQSNQRLGIISVAASHNSANHPTSPTAGSLMQLELRHASPWVLSDSALRFNTIIGSASKFFPLSEQTVLAFNIRAGAVFTGGFKTGTGFIPPQERMYGGGPTSVRGFGQNELGASAYTAFSYYVDSVSQPGSYFLRVSDSVAHSYRRAVPVGGNSLLVGNAELRFRTPLFPEVLEFAAFTDVGDVWNRGQKSVFQNFKLKVTPGLQVAAHTPVGPVRVVVGYNRYERPNGPLYFESGTSLGGTLPCVSPGNTLNASRNPVTGEWEQEEGSCPSTFVPQHKRSFRSRLTLNLAIGQAF